MIPDDKLIKRLLADLFGSDAAVTSIEPLDPAEMKQLRHSDVYRVCFRQASASRSVILKIPRFMASGDQHVSNRVRTVLWQHEAFNKLPSHVKAHAAGVIDAAGQHHFLNDVREAFIIEEDLAAPNLMERFSRLGRNQEDAAALRRDVVTCARYLSSIHKHGRPDVQEHRRVIRDYTARYLRLIDDFPREHPLDQRVASRVVEAAVKWHWRLRSAEHRLCAIHGDFHPGNIIIQDGRLQVIDRKHTEQGDPNEDLAAFAVNIVFFSLARHGRLTAPYLDMLQDFFAQYVGGGTNLDYHAFFPPFLLTRVLVLVNPRWYLPDSPLVAETLLRWADRLCRADELSFEQIVDQFSGD